MRTRHGSKFVVGIAVACLCSVVVLAARINRMMTDRLDTDVPQAMIILSATHTATALSSEMKTISTLIATNTEEISETLYCYSTFEKETTKTEMAIESLNDPQSEKEVTSNSKTRKKFLFLGECEVSQHSAHFLLGTRSDRSVPTTFRSADSVRYNSVVCISPLFLYENWQLLLATIEYYRFESTEKIVIYVISAVSPIFNALKSYEAFGLVEIRPWTYLGEEMLDNRVGTRTSDGFHYSHYDPIRIVDDSLSFTAEAAFLDCWLNYRHIATGQLTFADVVGLSVPRSVFPTAAIIARQFNHNDTNRILLNRHRFDRTKTDDELYRLPVDEMLRHVMVDTQCIDNASNLTNQAIFAILEERNTTTITPSSSSSIPHPRTNCTNQTRVAELRSLTELPIVSRHLELNEASVIMHRLGQLIRSALDFPRKTSYRQPLQQCLRSLIADPDNRQQQQRSIADAAFKFEPGSNDLNGQFDIAGGHAVDGELCTIRLRQKTLKCTASHTDFYRIRSYYYRMLVIAQQLFVNFADGCHF